MAAGMLARCGYHCGGYLIKARASNPKGFFEDVGINRLNEALLAQHLPARPRFVGRWLFRDKPRRAALDRWTATLPLDAAFTVSEQQRAAMREYVTKQPFCYKDPRFSFTLPAWREELGDIVHLCIFREPGRTATSILKEVNDNPEVYRGFRLSRAAAFANYVSVYRHILERHASQGEWLFVHYDQLLDGSALERLGTALDCTPDGSFADASFRRSEPMPDIPREAQELYGELCRRAGVSCE